MILLYSDQFTEHKTVDKIQYIFLRVKKILFSVNKVFFISFCFHETEFLRDFSLKNQNSLFHSDSAADILAILKNKTLYLSNLNRFHFVFLLSF